ncbi:MAG: Ppx/GppA family phosphatase [Actinomycetota bacterium]|nr:Ppx/GppA family phosphatase [Actinomycetota bacterium]MDP9020419.1 Ppx/GppA family phosphatase [Actinomycetota bacterium]
MTPVAAVDCGTNSTRLLVARPAGDGRLETVERLATVTRLGAGVDATHRLAPEAVGRTVEALRRFRRVLDAHGVERVRVTATSAARDAANRDELFDVAEDVLGARPELLAAEEEARLAFRGATAELHPADGPFLVVDIGGGSTEFAVGQAGDPEGVISVELGCVRLSEQYLHGDPPSPEELSAALSVAEAHLDDVVREVPATKEASVMVGLAGTVTTVAAVEQGLASYDPERIHHFRLSRAAAEDVFRTLATEARRDRIHNPGLEEARADVIVGGCCVLVAVLRYFDLPGCLVSEADILDGLARSLLDAPVPGAG